MNKTAGLEAIPALSYRKDSRLLLSFDKLMLKPTSPSDLIFRSPPTPDCSGDWFFDYAQTGCALVHVFCFGEFPSLRRSSITRADLSMLSILGASVDTHIATRMIEFRILKKQKESAM